MYPDLLSQNSPLSTSLDRIYALLLLCCSLREKGSLDPGRSGDPVKPEPRETV